MEAVILVNTGRMLESNRNKFKSKELSGSNKNGSTIISLCTSRMTIVETPTFGRRTVISTKSSEIRFNFPTRYTTDCPSID